MYILNFKNRFKKNINKMHKNKFVILSINGGGIRGIIPALLI